MMIRESKQIRFNRSARTGSIRYIVIHDTGNPARGANADSHFTYFDTGNRGSSADFFVDDKKALQVNGYRKYYTWHCGDGRGRYGITNANSVGIEMCVNSDGDYEKAFENTIELTRQLMKELGIDETRVVRHYDASRKNCPQSMSANGWARWAEFKRRLNESEDLTVGQYEELKEEIKALKPMVYNYIDNNMPAWARPTIQRLRDKGVIIGDEKGRLGLTDDMLRMFVILDRQGVFN